VPTSPVLPLLLATRSLLDHTGGELVSTVRATASSCCSLARAGATATTSPEKPAEVASASSMSFCRSPIAPSSHHCLQVGFPQVGGEAGSYSVSRAAL